MLLPVRVVVSEHPASPVAEPTSAAVGAAVAPLADLGDELDVAKELVVHEVIVAT